MIDSQPSAPARPKTPDNHSQGRKRSRSRRAFFILCIGGMLIGISWCLRSSPWARENSLRVLDLPGLETSARSHPDDFLSQYYLAKAYYLAQRFPDAQAAYAEAVR